ncbi:STAS/SEC14 domain-containing protein [Microbulbifer sediminum]|uniref:STAS/SEC14 domain-containing protein n=1 Tax=Microbulbifer sediminum TaxID=2904250 RepID=UPI001F369898|nr:STAS/SEC14 domain-containing protein [Microbulbifer sediminum]
MMDFQRHGLSVGIERIGSEFFLLIRIRGDLTHWDYEIITPLLEQALDSVAHPQVKALVDIRELRGWEWRAAWDDLRLGLRHGSEFSQVALLGNGNWQELATRVANWFTGAELRYFRAQDDALQWLAEDPEDRTERAQA